MELEEEGEVLGLNFLTHGKEQRSITVRYGVALDCYMFEYELRLGYR